MSVKTTIELIDKMSSSFDAITNSGQRAMSSIEKGAAGASTAYEKLSQYCSSGDMDLLERSAAQAGVSLKSARDATLVWADGIDELQKSALEFTYTDEELVNMGYKVKDSLNSVDEAAEQACEGFEKCSESADDAGKNADDMGKKSKSAIDDLDSAITSAGIVVGLKSIANGFIECSEASEIYESSIAKLETISGSSAINSLNADITDLSNQTGASADGLANVAYNAISAGSAVEESVDRAQVASKLATAGFTDETSALSVLSTALNSYGDAAGSAEDIADSLITVQNLGVTTVAELATQMGKAISTASAYNVSLSNVETAYIATTKAGIATAESTTYIAGMFNELGKDGTDIANIIQNETGKSFGQLMNEGKSLADVLGVVYDSVDQNTEAFMNLWGSQEAGKAAAAIVNQGLEQFNSNLKEVENSAGATEKAYSIMADTTQYAHNRMTNAASNLKIAVGDKLNGAFKSLYNTGAELFIGAQDIIDECPAVVSVVSALATSVSVLSVAIVGYNAVTKAAEIAQKLWNASMMANPVFLVVTAVAALTAGLVVLISTLSDVNSEYASLTAASKEQYTELQNANAQYDAAVEKYGKNSEEAAKLAGQVEVLSATYENNKRTMEEWNATVDDVVSKHDQLKSETDDAVSSLSSEKLMIDSLAERLDELTGKASLNRSEQTELSSIVSVLNEEIDGLGLTFDKTTNKTNLNAEAIKNYYDTVSKVSKIDVANEKLEELFKGKAEAELNVDYAQQEVEAAKKQLDEAEKEYAEYANQKVQNGESVGIFTHWAFTNDEQEALDKAKENLETLQGTVQNYTSDIEELNSVIDNVNSSYEATGDEAADAFNQVASSVEADITNIIEAYNEAYEAAYSSIDGQIGLFDTMKTESSLSVSEMQSALNSQVEYLNTYTENLKKAAELGFSDDLISTLSDGTAESAGYLDALVQKAESLGGKGAESATQFVEGFNSKMAEVEKSKESWAEQVGKMETDFDAKMDAIKTRMDTAIKDMDASSQAAAAAQKTIDAYINAIKSGASGAASAATVVKNAASSALNSGSTTVPGHASGTTYGEDIYIAGEEGPELIVGKRGSTVFPASETNRIVEAVGEKYYPNVEKSSDIANNIVLPVHQGISGVTDKNINITVNGTGKIGVEKGADNDEIVAIMMTNIRPILTNLLVEEMAEEGEGNYEY